MSTPILTKKQQRQSLSAKKRPSRGLRNILAQPSESYWPLVNIDECQTLIDLMNKLLPSIKRATFKIPGSLLRHMTKEKRALARQEALEKKNFQSDENMLKSVCIGINTVTRSLERSKVCCVLIDANVEPPLLIKHIVIMAKNKKVPILLLPTLKTITLQTIGFATAALALKEDVMHSLDNAFHALYQMVTQIFQDFVQSSKCSLQLFESDQVSEDSTMCKMEMTKNHDSSDSMINISDDKTKKPVFTDVYKYRSSRNERAFIPPGSDKNFQVSQAPDEFISLSNEPDNFSMSNKDLQTNMLKNKRYVNIHEEDESEKSKKITACDESQCSDKSISIDNSNNIDTCKHIEENHAKTSKKCKIDDVTYMSLKIKRVQGNNNRIKATKFAKKKR